MNHPSGIFNRRSAKITFLILLITALLGVYWQSAHHDFINYDDQLYVTENNTVKAGLSGEGIVWAFTTFRASNWHPVTWLSHMLDVDLFGLNPAGHHAVNIVLHAVNTLLLLLLLFTATRSYWPSLFAAALFGLHPLHVESVAWIAERKDLLSTLFMLLTLILYGRYARTPKVGLYLATLGSYAAGLMAKPMLVTLPFAMLLWDFWPLGRFQPRPLAFRQDSPAADDHCPVVPLKRLFVEKLPFFALCLASSLVTYLAQHQGGTVASIKGVSLDFRIFNALWSYLQYIVQMFWPKNLAVIYPLPPTIPLTRGILAGIALLVVSGMVFRFAKKQPWLMTGWFWYLGTLVPVIGLVQVGQQAMADRYTYIPFIGLFILVAWGIPAVAQKLRMPSGTVPTLAIATVIAMSLATWKQIGHWKNGITLFSHTTSVVPNNHIGYRLLGIALSQKQQYAQAESAFRAALNIRPDDEDAYTEWGITLLEMKRPEQALPKFTAALQINPDALFARLRLAQLLVQQGRAPEAIEHYRVLQAKYPNRYYIANSLGSAYLETGNASAAYTLFRQANTLDPNNPEILYNMGLASGIQGRLAESVAHFSKAVALRPDFADAHYNLGAAQAQLGNMELAIRHFSAALTINPAFMEARKSLELALSRRQGTMDRPR